MKRRIFLVSGFGVMLLSLAFGYVFYVKSVQSGDLLERSQAANDRLKEFESASRSSVTTDEPDQLVFGDDSFITQGEVLFVNRVPGDEYGRLGVRRVDGSREILDKSCQRVHAANRIGLCLFENGIGSYQADIFTVAESELAVTDSWSTLLPSRARVSADGSSASSTGFLTGSGYQDVGGFSTIVRLITIGDTSSNYGDSIRRKDIDTFQILSEDEKYRDPLGNMWGVSFADSDNFYVTYGVDSDTEILQGSVAEETLEPTGWTGSCPSLSPDGSTLVVKEALPADGGKEQGFQLVAIDVASGERTPLAETRSVDDQIDWLDNDTILYALHVNENPEDVQPELDIWSLDINAESEPELFLPNADSPATYKILD